MAKIIGYGRVSSKGQMDGNSLENQKQELLKNGCTEFYCEQFTGKTTDRPVLKEVVDMLQEGDTLMATKLDRLARNVPEGIELIQSLISRGVRVHVLNVGLLENSPIGQFFITTLLAVASLERSFILERTAAGKAIARQKPGYREGRPSILRSDKVQRALDLLGTYSYNQIADLTGVSRSTLIRAKRLRDAEKYRTEVMA